MQSMEQVFMLIVHYQQIKVDSFTKHSNAKILIVVIFISN